MRQALPRPPRLEAANVAAFRFRRLDGRYLVTDELGRCRFLTPQAFRRLVAGAPPAGLARRRLRLERLASSWRRRQRLPWSGPGRHVVIVADGAARMTIETARSVVDTILESPNPELAVELRGAALKASRPVVSFLTAYARRKSRLADK
ncbi:MAG: hypothetical protein KGK30_02505, partial [Elusimicrobia bacterium]|nr:hypothetical protein [Elusimicrobiota bacterium]